MSVALSLLEVDSLATSKQTMIYQDTPRFVGTLLTLRLVTGIQRVFAKKKLVQDASLLLR